MSSHEKVGRTAGRRGGRIAKAIAAVTTAITVLAGCDTSPLYEPIDIGKPVPTLESGTPLPKLNPKYIGMQVCLGELYVPSQHTMYVSPISERKVTDPIFVPMHYSIVTDNNSHIDSGPTAQSLGENVTWFNRDGSKSEHNTPKCVDGANGYMQIHTPSVRLQTAEGTAEIGLETTVFAGPAVHDEDIVKVSTPADALHSCVFDRTFDIKDSAALNRAIAGIEAAAHEPYVC